MPKMFDSPAMRETLRRTVRSEMALKGLEYRDLSTRLGAMGIAQTESNLRSKINNGSLGAQLFMFLLLAMGTRQIELSRVQELLKDVEAEHGAAAADDAAPEKAAPDNTTSLAPGYTRPGS